MAPKFPDWKKDDTVYFACCDVVALKAKTHVDAAEQLFGPDIPAGFKCPSCGDVVPEGEA